MARPAAMMRLLLVTALLTACGQAPASEPPPLVGEFTASGATELGAPRPFAPGTEVKARFTDDGHLTVRGGCNTLSGRVDAGGGALALGEAAVTEMACDEARTDQDRFLVALFSAGPTWRLDGDTLLLAGGDATLTLTRD
ncbi:MULTISPECIES: META domain-containing protein [Actinosynnema]|uniref:META domain-containing protein n=1 Tax=Actinosynnema TaxID=40566 RepID=UPI0020A2CCB3|nr:META domain-containing protein [Actinosynnema pretiosum]MCP2094355.1 Heat shock protein HslJ [Actinosynnema pretiosum]